MDFNSSKTKECVARAFAGECQDGARYQFMAKSAVSEGFSFISDQLKILAKNEMAHASRLYTLMVKYIGNGKDNVPIDAGYPFERAELKYSLKVASEIEDNEATSLYPAFAKIAKDEGFAEIGEALSLIAKVEESHRDKLKALAQMYKAGKLYKNPEKIMWTCSNCGHCETKKEAWQTCPLCGYPQGYVQIPPQKMQ